MNRNNETDIIRNIPIQLLFNIYLRVWIRHLLLPIISCLYLIMTMGKKNNVRQQSCDSRLRVITKNIYDNSWHFRICFQENHTSFKADHNRWIIYGAEDVHNNSQIQYICYITGRLVCLFALLIRNYVNLAR